MKKLSMFLATAVLATSSLALGAPAAGHVTVRDHRGQRDQVDTRDHRDQVDTRDHRDQVDTRDHRTDNHGRAQDSYDNYESYNDNDSAFTRDQNGGFWRGGQRFIRAERQASWTELGTVGTGQSRIAVGANAGLFRSVQVEAKGWIGVKQVLIRFTDGTEQRVMLRSTNAGRGAPYVINLNGAKQIRAIIVVAAPYGRGRIEVSALPATRYYWRQG